ncbi:MAG: hypothetical protein IPJ49_29315 [Candidatus Obscuribacter sp.]|nr:hypothetical protein [Candidatus Obscuribacter sp.]
MLKDAIERNKGGDDITGDVFEELFKVCVGGTCVQGWVLGKATAPGWGGCAGGGVRGGALGGGVLGGVSSGR